MADNPQAPPSENLDAFQRLPSTDTQIDEPQSWFFAVDPLNLQLVEWSSNLSQVVQIPEHQLATFALADLLDAAVVQLVREFISTQTLCAFANVQGVEAGLGSPHPNFELRLRTHLHPSSIPCLLTQLTPVDHRKLLLHFEPVESRTTAAGQPLLNQLAESAARVYSMNSLAHNLSDLLAVAREEFGKVMNVVHIATWQRRAEQFVLVECTSELAKRVQPWTSEFSFPRSPEYDLASGAVRLRVLNCVTAPWSSNAVQMLPGSVGLLKRLGAECCVLLSLYHGDTLWGLLAGYCEKPRCLSATEQAAGETLATILSLQISSKLEALSRAELELRLEIAQQATAVLETAASFSAGIHGAQQLLQQAMNADGMLYAEQQQTFQFGDIPEGSEHRGPFTIDLDDKQKMRLLFYRQSRVWTEVDQAVGAKLSDLLLSNHRSRMTKDVCSEMQRLNEDLTAFAYSVSHDLRAPLRAATQALFFLEKSLPDPPAESIVLRLAQVKQAHNHLSDLIDAVLRLSRAERLELQTEQVELSDVIDQAAEVSLGYHPREHTYLNVLCKATLQADFVAVRDVFVNLFSNALRYNRSIRKEITVGICVINGGNAPESEFGRTAIFCRDNGIGIALEHHQEVFDLFRRFSPSDVIVPDGTGAGLAIVKRIVERHGGKIWIESQVGSGTTFYFTLGDNALLIP